MRKALEEKDIVIPNQLGKPIKNPTLRWIYQMMSVVSVVCLWDEAQQRWIKKVCNLKKIHAVILHAYSSQALDIYGLPSTIPPPDYDKQRKPLMA